MKWFSVQDCTVVRGSAHPELRFRWTSPSRRCQIGAHRVNVRAANVEHVPAVNSQHAGRRRPATLLELIAARDGEVLVDADGARWNVLGGRALRFLADRDLERRPGGSQEPTPVRRTAPHRCRREFTGAARRLRCRRSGVWVAPGDRGSETNSVSADPAAGGGARYPSARLQEVLICAAIQAAAGPAARRLDRGILRRPVTRPSKLDQSRQHAEDRPDAAQRRYRGAGLHANGPRRFLDNGDAWFPGHVEEFPARNHRTPRRLLLLRNVVLVLSSASSFLMSVRIQCLNGLFYLRGRFHGVRNASLTSPQAETKRTGVVKQASQVADPSARVACVVHRKRRSLLPPTSFSCRVIVFVTRCEGHTVP